MSFSQLPLEVLEIVFRNLDGASFCLIQSVCKTWYKVLKKLLQDKQIWHKFCVKDIPNDVIVEMLSYKTIPLHNIIEWKSLYKKWYKAKFFRKNTVSIQSIQAFGSNPVTCMKASGSWIISGHSNGDLCIWNQVNGKLSQHSRCHLRAITDLALVDIQTLGSYYGFETLPWSHHHVITVSKDTCIKVKWLLEPLSNTDSDLILNRHGAVLASVRIFGNQFAVNSHDNTITLWSLNLQKQPYVHLEVELLRTIIGGQGSIHDIGFWYEKIYCTTYSQKLKIYDSGKDEWQEETYFPRCLYTSNGTRLLAASYYLFRDQIVFVTTACGKMIVSVKEGNYKSYKLMTFLRTLIVSIALKGTILALGGENGRLYLFHIPTTKSLLDIDLARPAFQYTLSEASIVKLDIMYEVDTPVVIATTTHCLFILKWSSKNVALIERADKTNQFASQIIVPPPPL